MEQKDIDKYVEKKALWLWENPAPLWVLEDGRATEKEIVEYYKDFIRTIVDEFLTECGG